MHTRTRTHRSEIFKNQDCLIRAMHCSSFVLAVCDCDYDYVLCLIWHCMHLKSMPKCLHHDHEEVEHWFSGCVSCIYSSFPNAIFFSIQSWINHLFIIDTAHFNPPDSHLTIRTDDSQFSIPGQSDLCLIDCILCLLNVCMLCMWVCVVVVFFWVQCKNCLFSG